MAANGHYSVAIGAMKGRRARNPKRGGTRTWRPRQHRGRAGQEEIIDRHDNLTVAHLSRLRFLISGPVGHAVRSRSRSGPKRSTGDDTVNSLTIGDGHSATIKVTRSDGIAMS